MTALPDGIVTFLFTDIEGSTRLLGRHPQAYAASLLRHDALMRGSVDTNRGVVFETVGDAVYAAFESPIDAVRAALHAQLDLETEDWGELGRLRARMAIHSGEVERRGDHYFGAPLYRCARLMAVGHGGQVLLSSVVADAVADNLPAQAALRAMGTHRLKDLSELERVSQLSHPDLQRDFPPLKSLDPIGTNLPAPETSFVGREAERRDIGRLLSDHRLITLTGAGGSGKTRLAIQVGQDAVASFDDGVSFVSLASIRDPELVPAAIATAVGVHEAPTQVLMAALQEALAPKELLVVLDNFEQVAAAAAVVAVLLARCPKLRVLVTSRLPLRLSAEHLYPVPPLGLTSAPSMNARERSRRSDATTLFLQRALAADPKLGLTDDVVADAAKICERLDGLPLAIELAAARTRVLPPRAILSRLGKRLALLSGGPVDAPERQQSLRATIEWSEGLLAPPLRQLFGRLAVFVDGFELGAAEAVCGADIEALSALVDQSLLGQSMQPDGEPRFVMLETIREYALEALSATGDIDAIELRHAHEFLRLAEEAHGNLLGSRQLAWLDRLDRDHENVRAAHATFMRTGRAPEAVRLAVATGRFALTRGHEHETRVRLESALRAASDLAPELRAGALRSKAALARRTGEFASALADLREAADIYNGLDDRAAYAAVIGGMAMFEAVRGNPDRAKDLITESLAINRDLGASAGIFHDVNTMAYVLAEEGDFEGASATFDESIGLARQIEDPNQTLLSALCDFAQVAIARADDARAAAALEEALSIARAHDNTQALSYISIYRGVLDCRRGRRDAGVESIRNGLAIARRIREPQYTADAVRAAAGALAPGDPLGAARLWGAAQSMYARIGASEKIDGAIYARTIEHAKAVAGEGPFASAWRDGQGASEVRIIAETEAMLLGTGAHVESG